MNKVGLLGGTSWHSTVKYYEALNSLTNERYNSNVNPPLLITNLNQSVIHRWQEEDNWDEITAYYLKEAMTLVQGGCKALAFTANTPHKTFQKLQPQLPIPILHIGDAILEKVTSLNLCKPLLLGTRFTMFEDFLSSRISSDDVQVVVPEKDEMVQLHDIIVSRLVLGNVRKHDVEWFSNLIAASKRKWGIDGVILACTELYMLIDSATELPAPIIDSVEAHIQYIFRFIHQDA